MSGNVCEERRRKMWHSIKKRPNVKNYKDIVTIIKKYVAMSLNLPSTNHRLFFFSFYCTSEISRKNSGNNNDKVHPVFCASSDVIVATICMMSFSFSSHFCSYFCSSLLPLWHRRRIYLEDKAKVVASDWGTESLPH